MQKFIIAAMALAMLAAPSAAQAPAAVPAPVGPAPAGHYVLDKNHGSLLIRIKHFDLSWYTARFTRFDAEIDFDPTNPTASRISARVDPTSIQTGYPDDYPTTHQGSPYQTFEEAIQGPRWLNSAAFPDVTFTTTSVTLTGANTADVVGVLTMRGVSHPATLHATFNGGYATHPMRGTGPSRIGFSARGTIDRTNYGVVFPQPMAGIPVGEEVELIVEAEFVSQ